MSWKYPEHSPKDGAVVEIDDLNRSFSSIASELDGGLNEHNWTKDTFHRTGCDEDVAIETWQSKLAVDPELDLDDPANDIFKIRVSKGWQKITSMTAEVTTGKTTLWIIGNLQHIGAWRGCCQYAVQVNGTVINETITGVSGQGYDSYHESWDTDDNTPSPTYNSYNRITFGPGIMVPWMAVGLDAVIDVPSGIHDVAIVARVLSSTPESGAKFHVKNRELIVLSLRR